MRSKEGHVDTRLDLTVANGRGQVRSLRVTGQGSSVTGQDDVRGCLIFVEVKLPFQLYPDISHVC